MSTLSAIAWFLTIALAYLVAPVALVWGWIRCVKDRRKLMTLFSLLSFSGLVLASASALYGLWVILYASANGFGTVSFTNYSPDYESFYKCVRYGAALSLLALLLALCGVWRRGVIRWHSLASARCLRGRSDLGCLRSEPRAYSEMLVAQPYIEPKSGSRIVGRSHNHDRGPWPVICPRCFAVPCLHATTQVRHVSSTAHRSVTNLGPASQLPSIRR